MTDTQRTLHFPADERWDETEVDFSDPEQVTIQQIDAHGITHTILLSNEMIANLRLHALKWTTANSPN